MEIKNSLQKALQGSDETLSRYERLQAEAEDRILAEAWSSLVDQGEPGGVMALVEVSPKVVESISAAGLVMPNGLPLQLAEVLKVGPGTWQDGKRIPVGLVAGDRVFIRGRSGIPIDPVRDLRLVTPGDWLYRIPKSVEEPHPVEEKEQTDSVDAQR